MSYKQMKTRHYINLFIVLAAVAAILYLIIQNLNTFGYIMIVALGFGAVIMIHEFGHFIVAKAGGIKVEAFSIGFPPTLMGIQKTEKGVRLRVLPNLFKNDGDPSEDGLIFYLGSGCKKISDTEYKIGLLPFGGFVAMLGQSDSGSVEASNDPKSYANKPIWLRIAVVAAGVTFNAISAVIIFMIVFLAGLDLPPAEVGGVIPGSPADIAGIRPGDKIVEVDGEKFVDFTSLPMAAALSAKGEEVSLMVQRPNDSGGFEEPKEINVVAKMSALSSLPIRSMGLEAASTLKIASFEGEEIENLLYRKAGLKGGDKIIAVNGVPVEKYWQLEELLNKATSPNVTLTAIRAEENGEETIISAELPLYLKPDNIDFEKGHELAHIYSMVPRLKIRTVIDISKPSGWRDKVKSWWRDKILDQEQHNPAELLKSGDIIVKIDDTEYPTFTELRKVTTEHKDKEMPLVILRENEKGEEEKLEIIVTPRQQFTRTGNGPVTIGIIPVLDESPVVGKTVSLNNGPVKLDIPSGATITAVAGEKVANMYDVMRLIRSNPGQKITIDYLSNGQEDSKTFDVSTAHKYITARSDFAGVVPFESLRVKYKASGPVEAVQMGLKKTGMFINQTILTLKRLFSKDVSPTTLSGPLGIVTMSYTTARASLAFYVYFLGLISSCIAVMNLLPLPIVDGGVIVLLIAEKIKGSPISQRVQETISYAGLVMILSLFAWLLYNDALNFLLSPMGS